MGFKIIFNQRGKGIQNSKTFRTRKAAQKLLVHVKEMKETFPTSQYARYSNLRIIKVKKRNR